MSPKNKTLRFNFLDNTMGMHARTQKKPQRKAAVTYVNDCTLTSSSFSTALLLVRLTSMVRLFFGAAIHRMFSRSPADCSGLCWFSSSSSVLSWGTRLGPFTASAGTTHSNTEISFIALSAVNAWMLRRSGVWGWFPARRCLLVCG